MADQYGPRPAGEDWPDPILETAAFQRRLDAEVARRVEGAQQQQEAALQALQGQMVEAAMGRVEDALARHAPYLAGVTHHPEFAEVFRRELLRSDPRSLNDPKYLASVAGAIAPSLRRSARAPAAGAEHVRGRREELGGQGTGPRGSGYTDAERATAERFGVSLEKARAAGDPTGNALRAVNRREQSKGRR